MKIRMSVSRPFRAAPAYTTSKRCSRALTQSQLRLAASKYTTTKNVLTANDTVTINVTLDTGAIAEVVQVEATYEKVQTNQSGNIGNIVNEKTLTSLPLNGRNPLDLVLIQPGVVSGANTGGGVHIFGARDRAINITLDGIDANETSAGTATFSPIRTNPDSLQEYRGRHVERRCDLRAQQRRAGGMITRAGTNNFHGTLFEFHRNRVFNANEWELNRAKFEAQTHSAPARNAPPTAASFCATSSADLSAAQSSRTASSSSSTRRFRA